MKVGTVAVIVGIISGILGYFFFVIGMISAGLHESRASSGPLLIGAALLGVLAVVCGVIAIAKGRPLAGAVTIAVGVWPYTIMIPWLAVGVFVIIVVVVIVVMMVKSFRK